VGATRTMAAAASALGAAGIASGPCFTPDEVLNDAHLAARDMLVPIDRTDGEPGPVIVPGNPVRLVHSPTQPDGPFPLTGEHTDAVLRAELGLTETELEQLRAVDVIR